MAVQVWIGEKPEHPNERRAIMALAKSLERLEGLYLILANFSVGGRSVDMAVIKNEGIFIIELKHCDGRVIGSVNGQWFVEGRNGERKRLNPGRKNPYNQVISYFHALTNFLNEHRRDFLSEHRSGNIDFRTCKRMVVISPSIAPDSEIEVDWKVELKGLDELPASLVTERSSEIELTDEEMLAIPVLLNCTPWQEINALVASVTPDVEQAVDPETAPPPVEAPPPAPPPGLAARALRSLRTTTGRFAAAMAALAGALFITLVARPPQPLPQADQPASLLAVTSEAEADFSALGLGDLSRGCSWSGSQLVGKRWDTQAAAWSSVAANAEAGPPPDVVVALEQISYCGGSIALTWSVRNNSADPVELPLRSDNISISDSLGNEYAIADGESEPQVLRVAPGAQERGIAVVPRALSESATALFVKLHQEPFGEAGFVIALR